MRYRHLLLIPVLALLAACSSKYPYPPQFVTPDDISVRALGAPPAKDSTEYNAEINRIIVRQHKLTDAQKAVIAGEAHIDPKMIVVPVLGPTVTPLTYPALYSLLWHVGSDAWRISDAQEDYWQSPRPWYADPRVQSFVPPLTQPGYPSGHTTTNSVWAAILADLFPEKRQDFFARASEIGYHRVDGGAHFPHDVEGGKRLGALIYQKLLQNPDFKRALEEARAETHRAN